MAKKAAEEALAPKKRAEEAAASVDAAQVEGQDVWNNADEEAMVVEQKVLRGNV